MCLDTGSAQRSGDLGEPPGTAALRRNTKRTAMPQWREDLWSSVLCPAEALIAIGKLRQLRLAGHTMPTPGVCTGSPRWGISNFGFC